MKIGGCVLAGGLATRAGGQAKEKFVLENKTFLEHILFAMKDLEECFISYNKEEINIRYEITECNHYRVNNGLAEVDIVPDLPQVCGKGPIGGLYSVLQRTACDMILFCPCDVPFFDQRVMKTLVDHIVDINSPVIIRSEGRIQTLCGIYPKSCLPIIKRCMEEDKLKIRCILDQLSTKYVDAEANGLSERAFWNVNTLTELEQIQSWSCQEKQ